MFCLSNTQPAHNFKSPTDTKELFSCDLSSSLAHPAHIPVLQVSIMTLNNNLHVIRAVLCFAQHVTSSSKRLPPKTEDSLHVIGAYPAYSPQLQVSILTLYNLHVMGADLCFAQHVAPNSKTPTTPTNNRGQLTCDQSSSLAHPACSPQLQVSTLTLNNNLHVMGAVLCFAHHVAPAARLPTTAEDNLHVIGAVLWLAKRVAFYHKVLHSSILYFMEWQAASCQQLPQQHTEGPLQHRTFHYRATKTYYLKMWTNAAQDILL